MRFSAALSEKTHLKAVNHLIRTDGQEDLCFGIWHPSNGKERQSALIRDIIIPAPGDRQNHGNASFNSIYFQRALAVAVAQKGGLVFMHSHIGPGWQGMSRDDVNTELIHAAATQGATGLPLVGMTIGTDGSWSGRFWVKTMPKVYERKWCESVRVIGKALQITYNNDIIHLPKFRKELERTRSAWGDGKQADLARLKVGVVGLGSVGSIVAEAIARMGIADITLIDFDGIETINLDRTLHATEFDAESHRSKVDVIAEGIRESATADKFEVHKTEFGITEEPGYRNALNCDILFSCVDRPWPRHVLNYIAYAHLIPVVDGGISVRVSKRHTIKGADWKAHTIGPGRRCLECVGQYDTGLVSAEREGYLDDPTYIEALPYEHPIKRNENVFAFSLSTASFQILQFLSMIISPLGVSDVGEANYHFVTGRLDIKETNECNTTCLFPGLIAMGDNAEYVVTGHHQKADEARARRQLYYKRNQMFIFRIINNLKRFIHQDK